jgi:hypothetical protein
MDSEGWRDCDNCGVRLARFRGRTKLTTPAEGEPDTLPRTLFTCVKCEYLLDPESKVVLNPNAVESEPCPYGAEKQTVAGTMEVDGYMTYVLDHECGCGKQFAKLVGSPKTDEVYVPQHKLPLTVGV